MTMPEKTFLRHLLPPALRGLFIGPRSADDDRVLRWINITRRRLATTLCVAATLATTHCVQASNAPPDHLPDASDVAGAWMTARGWVDTFQLPRVDAADAGQQLRGASAVCVILRKDGRIVGEATDATGDELMLRRAVGRALGRMLADTSVPSILDVPETLRAEFGRTVTMQLEIAGEMTPLPGKSFTEAARRLNPGLDGIALRRGENLTVLFPTHMLTENTAGRISLQFTPLAAELNLPPSELHVLARDYNVIAYRFRTIHLAQIAPNEPPMMLHRGDRVVDLEDITAQTVQKMTDSLAAHMLTRALPQEPALDGQSRWMGLADTYWPGLDQYRPLAASPRDQSIAAMALAMYAAHSTHNSTLAAQARDLARRTLTLILADASNIRDPASASAWLAALLSATADDRSFLHDHLDSAKLALQTCLTADTGAGSNSTASLPTTLAMCAYAAALALESSELQVHVQPGQIRTLLDRAWIATPSHQSIGLLPWAGWAELLLANQNPAVVNAAQHLDEVRTLAMDSQIVTTASADELDLLGAFRLMTHTDLVVDLQGVRPAAFLASMSGWNDSTRTNIRIDANRIRLIARWLRQLQIREDCRWTCRVPRRAEGGLRQAPWDSSQPLAGQAMGLLTLLHIQIALSSDE